MKKYALVVGIERYEDPEITNLSFAAWDAEDVCLCLQQVCGFHDVRMLVSGGDKEPDHLNIVDAMHNLAPLLTRDDLFLFYFAGHGIQALSEAHLLTSNSRIRMPKMASLSMSALKDCLSYMESAQRVLILDACRNDPRKGMGDEDNILTTDFSRDVVSAAQAPAEGTVPSTCVLFSCSVGQRAYEWPDQKHGAFTHYLLEGMRGAALDEQGRLTIQSLGRYVEQQVPRWAKKARTPKPQTPWGQQSGSWREIVLSQGTSRKTHQPSAVETPTAVVSSKGVADLAGSEEVLVSSRVNPEEQWVESVPEDAILAIEAGLTEEGSLAFLQSSYKDRISDWKKAAEKGVPEGQWLYGWCHDEGLGVVKREDEAANWYRKAAEQGYVIAQYYLGVCYDTGQGVAEDKREAFNWYLKAAERGFGQAQYNLGFCYSRGEGVYEDKREAVNWYHKAAEQGYALAQYNLGICYLKGKGVAEDKCEALIWLRKAAEWGDAKALINLGVCYYKGEGVAEDKREAVIWYRKAAEKGDAEGQFLLGGCYEKGEGISEDQCEAVKWYRKAAEQGVAVAQNALGLCYYTGRGVSEDRSETVNWYRKAADQGYAHSQCLLGTCYFLGTGISKDVCEAVKWYNKAADQGYAGAQFLLGFCYSLGHGVPVDKRESVKWYSKAAAQGHEGAIEWLQKLSEGKFL